MMTEETIETIDEETLLFADEEPLEYQRLETVLLVEDDEDLNEVLARRLTLAGLNVAIARDGMTAVDKVRELQPDVIVLDLGLPRLSGQKLLHHLRSSLEIGYAPAVIVITGDPSRGMERRVRGFGISGYYRKPLSPRQIARAVLNELEGY